MNDKKNALTDKVNVTMHTVTPSISSKTVSYAKVKRNTAYIGNVLDKVLETEKNLTRAALLYASDALRDGIIALLKEGKAVDVLELGTLYLKPASGIEKANPSVGDVPKMKAAFTPSELTVEAAKNVAVGENVTKSTEPEIESILDMKTEKTGADISIGGTVKVLGQRLKVDGDESLKAGVYFAPCGESGDYKADMSDWICVPKSSLSLGNTHKSLVFNAPPALAAGNYRLVVRTAFGSNLKLCKTVRQGVFSEVVTVA